MKRLAPLFALAVAIIVGMVGVSQADPAMQSIINQLQSIQQKLDALQATVNGIDKAVLPKMFYLTANSFNGLQALTACAPGFHMANLYEVLTLSGMVYNTGLGAANDDSGSGPPTGTSTYGWIRTGYTKENIPIPGRANCNAWTSMSAGDYGTIVRLTEDWYRALIPQTLTVTDWWNAAVTLCQDLNPVWCAQD